MSNSPLVDCVILSKNHSGSRKSKIDRITPHCVVGQLSAEAIGKVFTGSRAASCNYGIGKDGRVVLCVDEDKRSWCSSNSHNDNRAVTIECSSDARSPYKFNDKVYEKLIDLCADICKRNGKKRLIWIEDKREALSYDLKPDEMLLTVHRWFANKGCPGDWLYLRLGDLANKVTNKLDEVEEPTKPIENDTKVRVDIYNLNIRKGPGIDYETIGKSTGKGVFTITETKSGIGSELGLQSFDEYVVLQLQITLLHP